MAITRKSKKVSIINPHINFKEMANEKEHHLKKTYHNDDSLKRRKHLRKWQGNFTKKIKVE